MIVEAQAPETQNTNRTVGIQKPPHIRAINGSRLQILARDNFECQYCGLDLLRDLTTFYGATVDHVWPKARGGEKHPDNLVACCLACNELKRDYPARSIEDARGYITAKRTEFSSYLLRVLDFHEIEVPEKRGRAVTFHADLLHALGMFNGQAAQIIRRLHELGNGTGALMERLAGDRIACPFDLPAPEELTTV